MTEVELAKNFIFYLQDSFDLYFEVNDIDIIGKKGNILIGVEVKTSLNFKVIEQAYNNQTIVNYSYIAVPRPKDRTFKYKLCSMLGIGILTFHPYGRRGLWEIREELKPKFLRKAFTKWFEPHPNLKRSIPGSPSGPGVISAFKITVENIERYIKRHPGCTIKNIFNDINHHYSGLSSMRGSIYGYIHSGVIPTIKIENHEGTYKLYLKE